MGVPFAATLLLSATLLPVYSQSKPASPAMDAKSEAWDVLKKNLQDGDPEHRKNAIVALGTIGTPKAVKFIEEALMNDKSAVVRQSAAITLGDIPARASAPALQAALDDDAEVSFAAAQSLAKMGDSSGDWVLQEVLEGERSDKPGVVHRAIRDAKHKAHNPTQLVLMGAREAAGQLFGPASIGIVLVQMSLKQGGASGKVAAVNTLAKNKSANTIPMLEFALQDKHWAVRAAGAKALGERGDIGEMAKLNPLLTDDRDFVRNMAAASIIRLSQGTSGV